jgi:subtilisin family serine protease
MKRVNGKQMKPTRKAGWLLGPVVVSYCPEESVDEALAQARALATAAMVEVKSCTLDGAISGDVAALAAATGAGLIVLPGSLMDTVEGPRRLRAAMATARPVLLTRASFGGPVITVADAPRAGLGAMAVAADEARRLDRPLLVVHAAEGIVGATKDDLGPVSAMSLRACLETIRLRWGVAVRDSVNPRSMGFVAVVASQGIEGSPNSPGGLRRFMHRRCHQNATDARNCQCGAMLGPAAATTAGRGPWFAERPKPLELLYGPRIAANTFIQASGGIQ